jgi:hypothetical protein
MSVKCTECGSQLRIVGDSGSHPVDHFLLWNYLALKAERQYMNCVLSLAQALEIALLVTAHFVLVAEPVNKEPDAAPKDIEDLVELFQRKTRNMTLEPLRNLVMKLAVHSVRPDAVATAYRWVTELNNLAKDAPAARLIQAIPDEPLRNAVAKLSHVTIGALRNDVAHQLGRRPTEHDVEAQHEELLQVVRTVMTTFGVTPRGGQLIVGPPSPRT